MVVNEGALMIYLLPVAVAIGGFFAGRYQGYCEGQRYILTMFREQSEAAEGEKRRAADAAAYARADD